MLFNSSLFMLFFLPLMLVLYYAVENNYKNLVILVSSLVFYAWGEPLFCLMLLISVIVNHFTGKYIAENEGINKKAALIVSVVFNLGVAGVFRYAEFLSVSLREFISLFWMGLGSFVPVLETAVPFGLAIYTLQALSYNIDIYKGTPCQKNFIDTGSYLAFFPRLIAGPIVKYKDILPQLTTRENSLKNVSDGFLQFSFGLIKKVLVANNLKLAVDGFFGLSTTSLSISLSWTGVICLALQIYYEFSGYIDMALGLSRMFGFNFPDELKNPYSSHSVSDFWKNRWRVSISSWFKEYVYIPLGGKLKVGSNAESRKWMYINMGITIFLCALWHTPSWLAIIVGVYYGFFLMIEKTKTAAKLRAKLPGLAARILGNIYSSAVIIFGWMMLRVSSPSQLWTFIKAMAGFGYINTRMGVREFFDNESFIVFIIALIFALPFTKYFLTKLYNFLKTRFTWTDGALKTIQIAVTAGLLIFVVLSVSSGGYNEFEYFRY